MQFVKHTYDILVIYATLTTTDGGVSVLLQE